MLEFKIDTMLDEQIRFVLVLDWNDIDTCSLEIVSYQDPAEVQDIDMYDMLGYNPELDKIINLYRQLSVDKLDMYNELVAAVVPFLTKKD